MFEEPTRYLTLSHFPQTFLANLRIYVYKIPTVITETLIVLPALTASTFQRIDHHMLSHNAYRNPAIYCFLHTIFLKLPLDITHSISERNGKKSGSVSSESPRSRKSSEHLDEVERRLRASSKDYTDSHLQLSQKYVEEVHYETTI